MTTVQENACRSCREMVPANCVRCPFCRSFMRVEMEEFHRRQQLAPKPVIYSDRPPSGPADCDDTATE